MLPYSRLDICRLCFDLFRFCLSNSFQKFLSSIQISSSVVEPGPFHSLEFAPFKNEFCFPWNLRTAHLHSSGVSALIHELCHKEVCSACSCEKQKQAENTIKRVLQKFVSRISSTDKYSSSTSHHKNYLKQMFCTIKFLQISSGRREKLLFPLPEQIQCGMSKGGMRESTVRIAVRIAVGRSIQCQNQDCNTRFPCGQVVGPEWPLQKGFPKEVGNVLDCYAQMMRNRTRKVPVIRREAVCCHWIKLSRPMLGFSFGPRRAIFILRATVTVCLLLANLAFSQHLSGLVRRAGAQKNRHAQNRADAQSRVPRKTQRLRCRLDLDNRV